MANTQHGMLFTPGASPNGTEITSGRPTNAVSPKSRPVPAIGVRFYVPTGGSVTYFFGITGNAPGAAPALVVTQTGPLPPVDEPVDAGTAVFVTAISGGVTARWVKL